MISTKASWLLPLMIGFASMGVSGLASSKYLSTPIEHFQVDGRPFEQALRELARLGGESFVIGLEVAEPRTRIPLIHLSTTATVGQILSSLCAQNANYTFSDPGDGVIDVYPAEEPAVLRKILDIPVDHLTIETHEWPQNILARLPEFVPELQRFFSDSAEQRARETGNLIPGAPGVTMSTDVKPPLMSLSLADTTVRGILNAIAAYTLKKRGPGKGPTLGPTGWEAKFISDATAPTGLGGYLKITPFP